MEPYKISEKSDYSNFPDRKTLNKPKLVEEDGFDRDLSVSILEKQKEFMWTRVYLKEDLEISPEDIIKISYQDNESIELQFICYNKKDSNKDTLESITEYNTEDDMKVLCLKVDVDLIELDSEHIPFIRSLFKKSKWHQRQIFRKEDLRVLYNDSELEYIFIDF
jgi:hypothetical protein